MKEIVDEWYKASARKVIVVHQAPLMVPISVEISIDNSKEQNGQNSVAIFKKRLNVVDWNICHKATKVKLPKKCEPVY